MKNKNRILFLAGFSLMLIAFFMTGCASPATVQGMRPQSPGIQNRQPFSVKVQVDGGEETNPLWTSEISSESFAQAIRDGIAESGLFRSVITSGGADYLLEVSLVNVDKPAFGLDMTVNMATSWKLTRAANGKAVFQDEINKSHTATVGDAFVAIKRLRLAQEGAARESIAEGLQRISTLHLQGNE